MKRISIPFLACTFLSVPAQAALIAYDGFNYSAGALAGNSGGSGFGGAWTDREVSSTGFSVLTTGLAFSDLPVAGGRIQGTATVNSNLRSQVMRDLSTGLTGQIYGSYLYANNTAQRLQTVAGLQIGAASDATNAQTVQVYADEWQQPVGIRSEGTLGASAPGGSNLTIDVTYLVLFSANLINSTPTATMWVLNSAQYDTLKSGGLTEAELNGATVGTGSSNVWAKSTVTGNDATLDVTNNVNFFAYSGFEGAPQILASFDELRIGTTLASVIPEPSSALLGGLGLLALLRRRR